MRYSVFSGGKRLRPCLCLMVNAALEGREELALPSACALEMIHTYSLIHDDLPCMDDDDLRRGQPTVHIQYDEATAVLAGDAIQALAFEILADESCHADPAVRARLVLALAQAAGGHGMVAGQMIDLASEDVAEPDVQHITRLQQLKTGALIRVSCEAGAILGRAPEQQHLALHAYAHDLGLAFQIVDDVLDIVGDSKELGKTTGKDEVEKKATYPALYGIEESRWRAEELIQEAEEEIRFLGDRGLVLRELAHFISVRRY